MKKHSLLLLLLLLGISTTTQGQVKFENTSTDALRVKAEQAKKLVFIDLYATWCAPCRMMEREVFSRKDVGELMSEWFVCAKYSTGEATGKELLKRYGNNAIPLYLIFDTTGALVGRIQGGAPPKEFIEQIQSILTQRAKSK